MYCIGCGADNTEGSAHCIRCGQDLATLRTDRYTKPAINPASPILWNPDVAALLSIAFTPVFGAAIHALNWRRLGQNRRAAVSWIWATFILLAFLGIGFYAAAAQISEHATDGLVRLTQLFTLILWYFGAARTQGKHIAGKIHNEYFRESWFIPVSVAVILVGALYGLMGALM